MLCLNKSYKTVCYRRKGWMIHTFCRALRIVSHRGWVMALSTTHRGVGRIVSTGPSATARDLNGFSMIGVAIDDSKNAPTSNLLRNTGKPNRAAVLAESFPGTAFKGVILGPDLSTLYGGSGFIRSRPSEAEPAKNCHLAVLARPGANS